MVVDLQGATDGEACMGLLNNQAQPPKVADKQRVDHVSRIALTATPSRNFNFNQDHLYSQNGFHHAAYKVFNSSNQGHS